MDFIPIRRIALIGACGLAATACSVNRFAINKVGDALSGSSTTFASDDDPDLVEQATPFSLKLIESLLSSSPRHEGLLLAAASGFTEYAYAFVQQRADFVEDSSLALATELRTRARKLDIRARDYGLRGLDVRHDGFAERLRKDPKSAVADATKEDVPLMYWTAAAWGAAIGLSKDNPELVADVPIVEALIDRSLALDESYDAGAIHTFLITYEQSRQGATGDANVRSKAQFDRAVALSEGKQASPYLSYAEAVDIPTQNHSEFDSMVKAALAIDPNAKPEWRLANLIMQRRARWLLSRESELFLDKIPEKPRHQ